MEYLSIFIIILVISIILSIKLNKKTEETIPISVLGIILVIYIFGLFNNLSLGINIIKIITIALLIYGMYLIIQKIKHKQVKEIGERILTPGLAIYAGVIMISVILNTGRIIEHYDSFNHWALIVKNMFCFNTYGAVENSIINFNEYPPFIATFQYLFLDIKGQYSEDTIIIAQNILYFSMIMPLFRKINWEKGKRNLINIIPVIIFLPITFYSNFYTDILVDGFLGILFALGLYQIYANNEDKKYKYLILGTYIISISLTKNIGILLGIILIILEAINLIKEKSKVSFKNLGLLILILIILVGGWFIKVKISNANLNWDNPEAVYLQENFKEQKSIFVKNFFSEIINPQRKITPLNLSLLACLMIYITYSIYIYIKAKSIGKEKRLKSIIICIIITTIVYLIGMLVVYLTLFEQDEVELLSSFDRYICTMLLSGFFFNSIILCENSEFKIRHISIIITLLILLLPFKEIQEEYLNLNNNNIKIMARRNNYGKLIKYKNLFNSHDKIYFVTDEVTDYRYAIALNKYEMLPIIIGNENGIEYENLKQELENDYTYIYVLKVNKNFNNKYSEAFGQKIEFKQDSLYKINNVNNHLKVEKVLIKDVFDIL